MSDNFCPAPWTSIHVKPTGLVESCCVSKNELGSVNNNTIVDIINNDKHKSIKKVIIENNLPIGCDSCKTGPNNFKKVMVEKLEKYLPDKSFYQNEDNFQLRVVDLRIRNTCNYACVYCNAILSSLWASIDTRFQIHIESESRGDIIEYVLSNAATLNEIMLAGGEPLLIKENETILEKLLEVNPDVHIFVNSNLSQIKNNNIFKLLSKFKNVCWIVSVDDMGDKYNYIRWPGTWDNFYSNLLELQKNTNHNITFNMVYTILNAKSIFDCIDKFKKDGFSEFNINYVSGAPVDWLNPIHLPISELIEIRGILEEKIKSSREDRYTNIYQTLLNKLQLNTTQRNIEHLFKKLKQLDIDRNLDSQHVFPELYKLINTHYE
jgi:MoaA/NifB/PqqE/SkfB family radical SAM enzyme